MAETQNSRRVAELVDDRAAECRDCGDAGVLCATPDGEAQTDDGCLVSVAAEAAARGLEILAASALGDHEAVCESCEEAREAREAAQRSRGPSARARAILAETTWTTPPHSQGQTVEVSYGWLEGTLYRRTVDRSDGTTTLEACDDEASDALSESWHPVNGSPDVAESAWSEV